jgi:hypothetical protein
MQYGVPQDPVQVHTSAFLLLYYAAILRLGTGVRIKCVCVCACVKAADRVIHLYYP